MGLLGRYEAGWVYSEVTYEAEEVSFRRSWKEDPTREEGKNPQALILDKEEIVKNMSKYCCKFALRIPPV